MRIAMFYHSIRSCWNHGNAHFLRGVVSELLARGHQVRVFEPASGFSISNLIHEHGSAPLSAFAQTFPALTQVVREYDQNALDTLDLDRALDRMDLVIVHEWSDHALVARLGEHRRRTRSYRLLFHDTHHRAVTDPESMAAYTLDDYDGVLAFGRVLCDIYIDRGWAQRAWTWHEAADTRVFHPRPTAAEEERGDLVWIGNWGDEERTAELHAFLLDPVRELGLQSCVYGVRYPEHAQTALAAAGIEYGGWLANHRAPEVFARYRLTVHVPRWPYVEALPGIPTIRPFEALACEIPLVCSPWHDAEGLFRAGEDFLVARDTSEMKQHLRAVLEDDSLAQALKSHGRQTITRRHTCVHRVDELMAICTEIGVLPPRTLT